MKDFKNIVNSFWTTMHRYISPVFVGLLIASFVLWYIAKLNYNYTTEFKVKVKTEGQRIEVPCVVEGQGTNLLGYALYTSRTINVPLNELRYTTEVEEREVTGGEEANDDSVTVEQVRKIHIDPVSLRNVLAVHFSDIKIISIGEIPTLVYEDD